MCQSRERSAVAAEALSWLGTPYHHHARIKGVGVDCAQILCEVYEACRLVPHVDPGFYATDWHLHRGEELYMGWLERSGARQVQTPALGDVALFRFGRCFSHGGIVVEASDQLEAMTVLHAYLNRGVILSRLSEEPLDGRAVQFWTLW